MLGTLGSSMSDNILVRLLQTVSHHLQSLSALHLKFPLTPCCSNYWVTTDFWWWTFARCISSKLQSFAIVLSLINSTHIIMGISVSQYFLHPKIWSRSVNRFQFNLANRYTNKSCLQNHVDRCRFDKYNNRIQSSRMQSFNGIATDIQYTVLALQQTPSTWALLSSLSNILYY